MSPFALTHGSSLQQTDCVDPNNCYAALDSRLEQYINANRCGHKQSSAAASHGLNSCRVGHNVAATVGSPQWVCHIGTATAPPSVWPPRCRVKLGAPADLAYRSCSDPPYWSLWDDMTKSYDDLVAALLDSGGCTRIVWARHAAPSELSLLPTGSGPPAQVKACPAQCQGAWCHALRLMELARPAAACAHLTAPATAPPLR